uniref:Uncharacterized protein n=1 Tax=Picea glauca TaxID=3330 RepID=A0A117NGJ1_PICGL|nr:hypothetical protein ABT39_MTgene6333 [Picea glauca]QHR87034.1 hypothetical protein Q903MT_gene1043 [Picea sitchensis]
MKKIDPDRASFLNPNHTHDKIDRRSLIAATLSTFSCNNEIRFDASHPFRPLTAFEQYQR